MGCLYAELAGSECAMMMAMVMTSMVVMMMGVVVFVLVSMVMMALVSVMCGGDGLSCSRSPRSLSRR